MSIAAALAGAIPADSLGLAAGAYRDGTRVAGADPDLWTAIFAENRELLLEAIAGFETQLASFRQSLIDHDFDAIRSWWQQAARERRSLFPTSVPEEIEAQRDPEYPLILDL